MTPTFWPDELPSGTDWEKGLSMAVVADVQDGLDGLRAMVRENTGYWERSGA